MEYITYKRFKGRGIGGDFNLPHGTLLQERDGYLCTPDGRTVCAATSENGWEHFCPNTPKGKRQAEILQELYRHFERHKCAGELTPDDWPGQNRYWKNLLRTAPLWKLEKLHARKIGGRHV